ncbi:hypothetical protein ACEQ8H_000036 [Pleosporales sp. CAS-2024a]
MGRQAYLAKLAFGRSAFESTQQMVQSDEYMQLESAHAELPRQYQAFNGNNYTQLYDERGNPMNPRSREYGNKFRNAQNDVLAAVGVVERRPSPNQAIPGSYEARLDALDVEDSIGLVLGATFTLSQHLCTWWIGTLRDRILTFRYHDAMPLALIFALEQSISGTSIVYASFVPTMAAAISAQTLVYHAAVFRPVARLINLTGAGSRTRGLYRRFKKVVGFGFRVALEAFFYPFYYHGVLQRLGLIPALPCLPRPGSLNPFSTSSPLWPFSAYYDASASSAGFAKAFVTSPAVVLCGQHLLERCIYDLINEAVDASVICPDNADIVSASADDKHRMMKALVLRRPSPPLVRQVIEKLIRALGWGTVSELGEDSSQLSEDGLPEIEMAATRVTNVRPLELGIAQAPAHYRDEELDGVAMPGVVQDELERPRTPVTPTTRLDDTGPRIRITSREDVVEMEVRLPQPVLSGHGEVGDGGACARTGRVASHVGGNGPHHRVSHLSLEPSDKISAILKAQVVGFVVLPLRLVALRLVASHYLRGQGGGVDGGGAVVALPGFTRMSLRSIGVQVSRVALCSMFGSAVDLSLWVAQYAACVYVGKQVFGWGSL